MEKKKPLVLVILDGWGVSPEVAGNATLKAKLPFFNSLVEDYPSATLSAASEAVGLTLGEVGNSEVGHLNIGSGRVVWQDLARISRTISDKSFFKNPVLVDFLENCAASQKNLHLIGMVSDGGVHSHLKHLLAVIFAANLHGLKNVFIHMITDGRDTPARNAKIYLETLEKSLSKTKYKIATVCGRYWAMDREQHWDRTEKTYETIVAGTGRKAETAVEAINIAYSKGEGDEFIKPTIIFDHVKNEPVGLIQDGDSVLFFHFRADRMRQLTASFIEPNFNHFPRTKILKNLNIVLMTKYDEYPTNIKILFPTEELKNGLAETISAKNLKQLHTAETTKYAHVTYFFNGGREKPFPGEDRILVPSPEVATYDLKPEMSAPEVCQKVIDNLTKYDFIVVNFANPDMVGHTGNMNAVIKALETVDKCLEKIVTQGLAVKGSIIIIADHGDAEQVENPDKTINKEHTINPVPFIIIRPDNKLTEKKALNLFLNQPPVGILADIAPTCLDILGVEKPAEMTGQSLLKSL